MRFGIPLLADRVAPRCTFADAVLVVSARGRRLQKESKVPLNGTTWVDLAGVLAEEGVETLVCGGISRSTRDSIAARNVEVIENVAGTSTEILEAIRRGRIRPGYGLGRQPSVPDPPDDAAPLPGRGTPEGAEPEGEAEATGPSFRTPGGAVDCIRCRDRVCLRGEGCPHVDLPLDGDRTPENRRVVEAAVDVAWEEERTLCRLAELVYFGLEMEYRRVGVAFCIDLLEPATILTDVLRRFFEVIPVCCKVAGERLENDQDDDGRAVACDPAGQASILNAHETDLNVLVGLCVGADTVFTRESRAPATTIFVKDKSLANNPIGAVYSHHYLTDI